MTKNKIDVYHGIGSFVDDYQIKITSESGEPTLIKGKHIVIATGSKPIVPPSFNYDKKRVITSTEALSLNERPASMVIVGAGVIGLELGSVFARLGTKVEVIEFADKIISTMDTDCGKELQKVLKKEGFTFHLNHGVTNITPSDKDVVVEFKQNGSDEVKSITADYCLVAIGRRPYTDGLELSNAGVQLDEKGRVAVDASLKTSVPHIFAIGDVVTGAMLAHKAEEEGVFVAESIAGQHPHVNYDLIPGVVYTWPEVAAVGKTEDQLKAANIKYKVGKFPFKALGRAKASGDEAGFVKVLADAETDEVLGVHMIGPRAADLIGEAVVAMEFRASAEDIGIISHAHPTFSEAIKEAALDASAKRALNF